MNDTGIILEEMPLVRRHSIPIHLLCPFLRLILQDPIYQFLNTMANAVV